MRLIYTRSPRRLVALLILALTAACSQPAEFANQQLQNTAQPSQARSSIPWTGTDDNFSWLELSLPAGWEETAPARFTGPGGFAALELRDSQGAGPGALCFLEANRGKPARYGAFPEIRDTEVAGQPACLILPSADQSRERNAEALYLLWLPESIRPGGLLALRADRAHIENLVESLAFAEPTASTPGGHTLCDFSLAGSRPEITRLENARIDQFPIARGAGCSPYAEPVHFHELVRSGAAAEREAQVRQRQWQDERLERLNEKLAPFGYELQAYNDSLFRVMKDGEVLRSNLSWLGQVTVRADGRDFIFPVVDSYNAASFIIRADGEHAPDKIDLLAFDLVFPVYTGEGLVRLEYDYERIPRPTGDPALLQIKRDGEVIQTWSVSGSNPANGPVRGVWAWQGSWFVELPGLVIQDGEILNDQLGYPEIFTWRLLNDRPFFFYRNDGQVHSMYNGQPLPVEYDEVLAKPQWTDRILVDLRAYESGLAFFARRGETWYYVVYEFFN